MFCVYIEQPGESTAALPGVSLGAGLTVGRQEVFSGFWDVPAERFEGDRFGFGAAALSGVEGVNGSDLVAEQLEVEHVDVLGDAAWFGGFGYDRATLLQSPRSITCAGLFPWARAMPVMTGSSRVLPWLPSR